jgi:hypothetical protein
MNANGRWRWNPSREFIGFVEHDLDITEIAMNVV